MNGVQKELCMKKLLSLLISGLLFGWLSVSFSSSMKLPISAADITYIAHTTGSFNRVKKISLWLNDEEAGCIKYEDGFRDDDGGYIEKLYVNPAYRRQGLAHNLMRIGLDNIKRRACAKEISLKAQPFGDSIPRDQLVAFYQKYNAQIIEQPNPYFVLMKIPVSTSKSS